MSAAKLPGEAAAAGVLFDGVPSINGAFVDGMHIGLWVAAGLCAVIAALVMTAVREPKHHTAAEVLEETVEGEAGHL